MKFYIKANSGRNESIYQSITSQFSNNESSFIYIDKNNDIVIEANIYSELGDRYHEFLLAIIRLLVN